MKDYKQIVNWLDEYLTNNKRVIITADSLIFTNIDHHSNLDHLVIDDNGFYKKKKVFDVFLNLSFKYF